MDYFWKTPNYLKLIKARIFLLIFFSLSILYSCKKNDAPAPAPKEKGPEISSEPADVAVKWADMTLYTVRFSRFNTPTYTSRSLGYLGLAMYESIVHGDSVHRSMSGQLNGLTLPQPESGKAYHWILSLNAAEETLIKLLYTISENSSQEIHQRIDSLSNAIYTQYSGTVSQETANRSRQYGKAIAEAIYNWSVMDGSDKAFNRNFEPTFVFPTGTSHWVPPTRGQTTSQYPLHPHWGETRTFVKANALIPVPAIAPFSLDPTSDYYQMYKAVYDKDKTLTQEEMEIAAWWGDDPTESFSPPGHSYYIATLIIRKSNARIVLAAEAYARTGMAVADAFINCWKAKTTYFNERPSSFVKKYIDKNWIQFWPEPPFPAFPSGHSSQSGAAATVLTSLFGEPYAFTDDAHTDYRRYDDARFLSLRYPSRNFTSIWEAARECAYSRFLGGIHTKQDNDIGQQEGIKVGENINALNWSR
jgi:PAP2 superfamily